MATEYGTRFPEGGGTNWIYRNREDAQRDARRFNLTLIAREVSEPRIVSIRA